MLKKSLALILLFTLSLSLFACNANTDAEPTEASTVAPLPMVAVLSLELDENTQKAKDGFLDALSSNGYIAGENFDINDFVASDKDSLDKTAETLMLKNPALIYAIGTDAALAAKSATSEVPVVFSCVNDPVGSKLVESCESPEANVTGVCDYSPVFEQIELLHTLYPDTKRIGCIYNGADEESILSANLASGEAQIREIKFTQYPCLTEKEFNNEVETALEKCDALYLPDDALIKAELANTLKKAKEKNVPVFAQSSELVELGCLATCITDYEHIGYSAGELAVILLRSLKPVSKIPVEYATECTVVINAATQKALKLTIPEDISKNAVFVKAK